MKLRVFAAVCAAVPLLAFGAATAGVPEVQVQDFLGQLREELFTLQKKDFLARWGTIGTPFSRNLYAGISAREDVERLQGFLALSGYLDAHLQTGNFYTLTRKAVQAYQRARAVPATGFVGPLTRRVLAVDFDLLRTKLRGEVAEATSTLPASIVLSEDTTTIYKKYEKPTVMPGELERYVFEAINKERIAGGFAELRWSDDAARVARLHSEALAGENKELTHYKKPCTYPFIHHETSGTGETLGVRLRDANVFYYRGGENIAIMPIIQRLGYQLALGEEAVACPAVSEKEVPHEWTPTEKARFLEVAFNERLTAIRSVPEVEWSVQEWYTPEEVGDNAVRGWMDSEGHRMNILNRNFNEGGIGLALVNDYVILTQVFLGR